MDSTTVSLATERISQLICRYFAGRNQVTGVRYPYAYDTLA